MSRMDLLAFISGSHTSCNYEVLAGPFLTGAGWVVSLLDGRRNKIEGLSTRF